MNGIYFLGLLDAICEWIIVNKDICRLQDISSFIITLASVHYSPSQQEKLFEVFYSYNIDNS